MVLINLKQNINQYYNSLHNSQCHSNISCLVTIVHRGFCYFPWSEAMYAAYPMITHTPLVAGNLPIKTLVAMAIV